MRGNINWQVQTLFSGINRINTSKHAAKEAARSVISDAGRGATWHELGKHIGVYSYSTADDYRDIWKGFAEYAKAEFSLKNLELLTNEHAKSYLKVKIDQGLRYQQGDKEADSFKYSSFTKYASALEKLEVALNAYAASHGTGREYKFDFREERVAATKSLTREYVDRAYEDPKGLISAIERDKYGLGASIMYEGGCRVREMALVREEQLQGLRPDPFTGETKGWFEVNGKGGQEYSIGVSPESYGRLVSHIEERGEFRLSPAHFREALKEAAARSGQEYEGHGSHGLRWSHAQERHEQLLEGGYKKEQAEQVVSTELSHHRGDITSHYLGRGR